MNNVYDVGIIGLGIAGSFALYKLVKENKNIKIVAFDIGRPPQKRRRSLEGWLGCFPQSDGKLYQSDLSKLSELIGPKKTKLAHAQFNKILRNIGSFKITKDKSPSISAEKRLKKFEYNYQLNNYVQLYPKDIHMLSKHMSEAVDKENITFNFDDEVMSVYKQKNIFVINTSEEKEFRCKKLIIAVGRSGWRWAADLFNKFGIIENNDIARFGVRVECNSTIMKDFVKSNCTIIPKNNEFEIGPLSWNGTVIPEDHIDMAISSFRSNENRWKSDKVSFNLIGNRPFPNTGFEQTNRIGKLTFLLVNDRIIKEKISTLLNGRSKISIIPEYNWLKDTFNKLSNIIPDITKAYFHVPTIMPLPPKINLGNNLESEIDGMFVIGESAGVPGILSAALMGLYVAGKVCK